MTDYLNLLLEQFPLKFVNLRL